MTDVDDRLDRIACQLDKQGLGPVGGIVDETMSRLAGTCADLGGWLRRMASNQPLIALLLSCQVGYLFARMGRRHARR